MGNVNDTSRVQRTASRQRVGDILSLPFNAKAAIFHRIDNAMVSFSKSMFAAMGFREREAHEIVTAKFHNVTVFELCGAVFESETPTLSAGLISNTHYEVVASASINSGARALIGEDFVADEAAWRDETASAGPFLLVHVGPTDEHDSVSPWVRTNEPSTIVTYDGFPEARAELRAMRNAVLPPLLTAVFCSFDLPAGVRSLREVTSESFGKTADGKTVHDRVITSSGFGYVARPMADGEVQSMLAETTELAKQIHGNVFPVFYAALSESDQMKRFFLLFLAIERQTHQAYKCVNHHGTRSAILAPSGRVARNVDKFVELRTKHLSNLGDKFVWCAIGHWQHLDDADIDVFFRLKHLRDDLAHGNVTTVPQDALPAVEQLAKKVLRQ
jgi:hypothetical protein